MPLSTVFFNITHRCNLDCAICLVKDEGEKRELDFSAIKGILDEAAALGVLNVSFSGGEPFLRPDFADIYRYAIHKGFLVSLYSNLTLLNRSLLRLFLKYPPERIQTTVYGLSSATYEAITRVKGSYRLFMKNLTCLRKNSIRLVSQFTVCKSNISDFERFLQLPSSRYEKKQYSFQLLGRLDRNRLKNSQINLERLPPDRYAALIYRKHWSKQGSRRGAMRSAIERNSDLKAKKLFWKCMKDSETVAITPTGYCSLCYEMPLSSYQRRYVPGRLKEIFSALLNQKQKALMPDIKCRDCPSLVLCPWCVLQAYTIKGTVEPVSYFCKATNYLNQLIKNGGNERKEINYEKKECKEKKV